MLHQLLLLVMMQLAVMLYLLQVVMQLTAVVVVVDALQQLEDVVCRSSSRDLQRRSQNVSDRSKHIIVIRSASARHPETRDLRHLEPGSGADPS